MKIYITADVEGVTGATDWDDTDRRKPESKEFREQMTAEVAAACKGALSAGATEIWVKDAHASGQNLYPAKLPREVRVVRAWTGHPFSMMQELDSSFYAALAIGYHSRAGTDASPLAHTLTGRIVHLKINGQYASEFRLSAYTAGLVGVPFAFLSGDAGICEEAQTFIPGLSTVAVKQGVGNATVSIHPAVAVERIRRSVEAALKADLSGCLVALPDRFSVEVRYQKHADAHRAGFYPGAQQTGPHLVAFAADDYFDVLRFLQFCV
jgi:D-amino peptidase